MTTTASTGLSEAPETRHQRVARHIQAAAEATGIPFDYLLAQANTESRMDPNAANQRSSAMGLYQFTAGTWLEMVKKHGDEHGLGNYADAITMGKDGKWTVADKDMKKEILDMRKDPRISALMAGEYASDNGKLLESKLGRKASTHDLYLAHFLGAGGALKVLRERGGDDQQSAAGILPEAAKANPELFHHQADGEAKSVDALYASVEKNFRRSMAKAAAFAQQLNKPPAMNLAELRPEARPQSATETAGAAPTLVAARSSDAVATQSVDLSQYGTFPVAITRASQSETGTFPVRLPPPASAARPDQVTLRNLIDAQSSPGKKGS